VPHQTFGLKKVAKSSSLGYIRCQMTQHQLEELTEDELAILFYIVNVVFPMTCPKMEFDMNSIKWHKHDMLVKKLLDAFPRLKQEGHATYSSLLAKLGVKVEIKYEQPPAPEVPSTGSAETSSEILTPPVETPSPQTDTVQTGSAEISENQPTGSV